MRSQDYIPRFPTFPAIFHAAPLNRDADIACVALFTTTKKNVEQIDTRRGRPDAAATAAAAAALMCINSFSLSDCN